MLNVFIEKAGKNFVNQYSHWLASNLCLHQSSNLGDAKVMKQYEKWQLNQVSISKQTYSEPNDNRVYSTQSAVARICGRKSSVFRRTSTVIVRSDRTEYDIFILQSQRMHKNAELRRQSQKARNLEIQKISDINPVSQISTDRNPAPVISKWANEQVNHCRASEESGKSHWRASEKFSRKKKKNF